jgi:hypothetical protein
MVKSICIVVHNDLFVCIFIYIHSLQVTILAAKFKIDTYKSYLVDPASSHMLVSKIKPCMSKYKHLYTVKLRTAHYISNSFFDGFLLHG